VDVRALGEREQPRDPIADLALLGAALRRRGHAARGAVDAEPFAHCAEAGAVRGLPALAEHLAHVLMRHLVLEHLDDDAPRLGEDERTR
jgi:hypothetical protein